MSAQYRFFHRLTGVVLPGSMVLPNEQAVRDNTPPDHEAIWADLDHTCQRIDPETLQVVPYEPPPVPAEMLAERARARRDVLLNETQWVVQRAQEEALLSGGNMVVPTEWLMYRQALRDLPSQPGFPSEITWPEMPE